jgi:RNA polymerase sigma-32 factor
LSPARIYSRDVATTAPLGPEEQRALAARFVATRDPDDRRRLVVANLRLVLTIAKSLGGANRPDFMDLVQEGNAGLIVAVERFDPSRGLPLAAYASIWIRAFILRHLMESRSAVRLTTTREGRRRFFERSLPSDISLDAPVRRTDDEGQGARHALGDFFPGDDRLRPDVAAEAREEVRQLREAVAQLAATLGPREREILSRRLLADDPPPLRRVGPMLRLSGERVRQLEHEMLARLRASLSPLGGAYRAA